MTRNNDLRKQWQETFATLPLIAILRGIQTHECEEIAQSIFASGLGILEIPLNSPAPFNSISLLTRKFPDKFVGAGTVTSIEAVEACIEADCKLIVTPNFNPDVARAVSHHDVIYCPGVATPSEAFAAIDAGADGLKLFPAEMITPNIVKALRAVLPADVPLIPVGGITPNNMSDYVSAGADGFGIGSALYKPGKASQDIHASSKLFVEAWSNLDC